MSKRVDLKGMSLKQQVSYFWDYYRYHVIVSGIALLVVGMIVKEISDKPHILLNVVISEKVNESTDMTQLEQALTMIFNPQAKDEEVVRVYAYPFNQIESNLSDLTQVYLEKFVAQVAISELDVFILEEQDFSYFFEQGIFKPLDELLQNLDAIDLNKQVKSIDNQVYAIRLDGNETLAVEGIETENKVITILSNSIRQEESESFILSLLNH